MTRKKHKHLTISDRYVIEKMILAKKYSVADIAEVIGCCRATIYNELKRATYVHRNSDWTEEVRYNPDLAEEKYQKHLREKGPGLKIGNDIALADYIEAKIINDKYSPQAVLNDIRNKGLEFSVEIKSVNTLYSYIEKGIFMSLIIDHLPIKKARKGKNKRRVQKRAAAGPSIEKRPFEADDREEFGNWEMDTVVGKQSNKKSLLVLTERKTRFEVVELLQKHTSEEVVKALSRVGKRFKENFAEIFKTITVDNGSEFNNYEGMKDSLKKKGDDFDIYYCHPYSSYERGSNENQNRLVRRHYPKGSNFDKELSKKKVKEMEEWINDYPRELFEGRTAGQLFQSELEKIAA